MSKQTTLCYIEKDGCRLMLHRVKKEQDENRDKWIGVGGKFLEGESPEDCVCREVLEETGLTLTDYRYRGIITFVSDVWPCEYMHLFTAGGFSVNTWMPRFTQSTARGVCSGWGTHRCTTSGRASSSIASRSE